MEIQTFIIDAFTDQPFKGNPAGVCLSDTPLNPELMQAIAGELNLSETAFLVPHKTNSTQFLIRYFTPTVEVPFCGHATLASAQLVLQHLNQPNVTFTTHHKLKISATRHGEAIKMLFPLYNTVACQPEQQLYDAFAIKHPVATSFIAVLDMLLIEVRDKETLLNIKPDFVKAVKSSDTIKELVITAPSGDEDYDFYSRCFCPWIGINEDPVTGAAHSVLAKYWGDRLGKTTMRACQASKRGGSMKLKILSAAELEITGNAQLILEGVMRF